MEIADTLRALTRRWYVVVLGLLLTAGAAFAVERSVPTTYSATGSILLMPSTDTVGAGGNPYLYLNGMIDARDVLVRRAGSSENRESVIGEHTGTSYVLEPDPATQSPIVTARVEGDSAQATVQVLDAALANLNDSLATMQEEQGVPTGQQLTAVPLLQDTTAIASRTTALRAAIVVVGVGTLGTLVLAGLLDNLLRHRRRHPHATADADNDDPPPADPQDASREESTDRPSGTRRQGAGDDPAGADETDSLEPAMPVPVTAGHQ